MSQTDEKTRFFLKASKVLIKDGETEAARAVLLTLNDPQAEVWLRKLGKSGAGSQSHLILGGGLLIGVLVFLFIGFGIGRASISSAAQNDPSSELFNFTEGDYQTATAVVEHSIATGEARQATNAVNSAYVVQSATARVERAIAIGTASQEALATWSVGRTATQAARDS